MKRTTWHCVVGLGLLAPSAGCLSLPGAAGLASEISSPKRNVPGKDNRLPTQESSEICLTLATDLENHGYPADAAIQLEKARSIDPKLKGISRRLGVLYDQIGEERKALSEFEDALKRFPKDPDLLNDVGYCHFNHGRWAQSESYFRQALAINVKHSRAAVNLGMALAQQAKFDEANEVFLKVLTPAQAKANIAFVLATQGKREEAIRAYRDALRADPALATAQDALKMLEAGGKVNLMVSTPPKTERGAAQQAAAIAACAATSCPVKEPAPDMSPVVIGPKRAANNAPPSNDGWEIKTK